MSALDLFNRKTSTMGEDLHVEHAIGFNNNDDPIGGVHFISKHLDSPLFISVEELEKITEEIKLKTKEISSNEVIMSAIRGL